MTIDQVTVHVLQTELPQPFAFSQGWVNRRSATLVEIQTSDGLTGWGEAFTQGLEAPEISATAIAHALRPLILGRNPLDTEVIWHEMYHRTRDFGRKGSVMAAISAVDTALWDLSGQMLGQPVWQLLGGAQRRTVQPYATGFYRVEGQGEAERLAAEAVQHHSNGFEMMKIKLGFGLDDDIAVMQAIVSALDGSGVRLMIDTNHAYGRRTALQLGRAIEALGCDLLWYEEPVVPEDVTGYAWLRDRLQAPVAGGENEHSLYGYRHLFAADAVDIAQPDLGSCGGVTAMRHISTLAQSHGVMVNPHVWGSAVAQAASLHLLAALPVTHHNLFADQPLLEFDTSSHPFRQQLTTTPVTLQQGQVDISDRPGLGITINRETLERYAIATY